MKCKKGKANKQKTLRHLHIFNQNHQTHLPRKPSEGWIYEVECTLSSSITLTYLLHLKQKCKSSETEGCVSIIYHSICLPCNGTKGLNKTEITVSNSYLPSQTIFSAHKQTAPPVFISAAFLSCPFMPSFGLNLKIISLDHAPCF